MNFSGLYFIIWDIRENVHGRECISQLLPPMPYPVLIAQYVHDLSRASVIPGRYLDSCLGARSMAYLAVADVDSNVIDPTAAGIKYEITRTHLARGNGTPAVCLRCRTMRQGDPKLCHNRHRETGTVRAVCKACASPYIRIADELYRIVGNLSTFGRNASCL